MQQVTPAKSIKSFFGSPAPVLSTPSPPGPPRSDPSISATKVPAVREAKAFEAKQHPSRATEKFVEIDLSIEVEKIHDSTNAEDNASRDGDRVDSTDKTVAVEAPQAIEIEVSKCETDGEKDQNSAQPMLTEHIEEAVVVGVPLGRPKRSRKQVQINPVTDGESPKKVPRRSAKTAIPRCVPARETAEVAPAVEIVQLDAPVEPHAEIDLTTEDPLVTAPMNECPVAGINESGPSPALVVPAAKAAVKRAKPAKPEVVLPAAVSARIDELRAQAIGFINELNTFEASTPHTESDINMNHEAVMNDLINALKSNFLDALSTSPLSAGASDGAAEVCVSTAAPTTVCDHITRYVCCLSQGSRLRLSDLAVLVVQKLRDTLLSAAKSMVDDASNDSEVLAKALKIANGLRAAFPDNKFVRVANECLETDDSVKSAISTFKAEVVNWAIREAYGYRARDAVAFENEDVFAMWSWYITKSNAVFSNQEQAIVKECIATRSRYGRAVKATLKVAEQLQTTPDFENAAVLSAQERASKAILEVERAKQKRQELERKRLSDLSKAQQKEDQKLAKQREKEEAATRKKEEAVAEAAAAAERKRAAEEAAAQEKRLHEETLQKKLDKQRSLMQAFLQVAPKPSAPFDSSSAKGAVAPVVAESTAASSVATPDTGFDLAEFESLVFSGPMALSDIPRGDLRRISSKARRGKKRRAVTISVSMSVPSQDAFGPENYSEIRDITLDGKKKLLAFHDYSHTEYWGTFSKRSKIITGRRPLAKDISLRNYDVDSADEWEDEDVGEDIGDSGEEDEGSEANEPDELVFDDFFRHDDDFGSDAENENMGGAPTASIKRPTSVVKSSAGPRFINTAPVLHHTSGVAVASSCELTPSAHRLNADGLMVLCDEYEKDVLKLQPFFAVVYPPPSASESSAPASSVAAMATGGAGAVASSPVASSGDSADETPAADGPNSAPNEKAARKMSDVEMKAFISLVHGQKQGIDKIVETFKASFPELSKNFIQKTLQMIAVKERAADGSGSLRWMVKPEVIAEAGVEIADVVFTPVKKKMRITPTAVASPVSAFPSPSMSSPAVPLLAPEEAADFTVPQLIREASPAPTLEVAAAAAAEEPLVASSPVCVAADAARHPRLPASEPPKAASASASSNKSKASSFPPKGQKQLLSFFKPGGSTAAPAARSATDRTLSRGLLTPEKTGRIYRTSGRECEDHSSVDSEVDVFERLAGSPTTTPLADKPPAPVCIDDLTTLSP